MERWDIGIDLDGVLYPFDRQFAREARLRRFGNAPDHEHGRAWQFYRAWGMTDDEFLDMYAAGVRAGRILWRGRPYPGTLPGWRALAQAGHRLHVITDRRPAGAEQEALAATQHWLRTHRLEPASVTISPDKTTIVSLSRHPSKVAFIDDRPENHAALLRAGVRAYLMDRPWNATSPGPRVRSLPEFASAVSALTGG